MDSNLNDRIGNMKRVTDCGQMVGSVGLEELMEWKYYWTCKTMER